MLSAITNELSLITEWVKCKTKKFLWDCLRESRRQSKRSFSRQMVRQIRPLQQHHNFNLTCMQNPMLLKRTSCVEFTITTRPPSWVIDMGRGSEPDLDKSKHCITLKHDSYCANSGSECPSIVDFVIDFNGPPDCSTNCGKYTRENSSDRIRVTQYDEQAAF